MRDGEASEGTESSVGAVGLEDMGSSGAMVVEEGGEEGRGTLGEDILLNQVVVLMQMEKVQEGEVQAGGGRGPD